MSQKRAAPKYSIAFVIGFLKGKSAVLIHRKVLGKKRVSGLHYWARGYCVSTVGLDEETIRNYIREQEKSEQEQLELEFDDEKIAPTGLSQYHRPPREGLLSPPASRVETQFDQVWTISQPLNLLLRFWIYSINMQ